jgi:hypothetical protein
MSYGDHLATTAAALARAHAALRDPPPDPAARASAAVSRVRLYRNLELQVVALGSLRAADLPPLGSPPAPPRRHTPVMALAIGLRQASAGTVAANLGGHIDLPAVGAVAVALREAYQALQTAGDILISNTGAQVGPGERHRPTTTDGMALLAGLGRGDNLAAVARLAAAAATMDVRMVRWMWPEEAPTELRPLLAAAEQDAWQTKSGPLYEAALTVRETGDGQPPPVLDLTAAPPVDDPLHWAAPTSIEGCIDGIDAARSWLTRHGDQLTVGQLATTARAALAITHYIGHVHMHLTPSGTDLTEAVVAAARPWRGVLQAVAELRSPVPARTDRSTLSVASAAVAAWLGAHVRPDGNWRGLELWAGDATGVRAWRTAATQIVARMPDLADLLQHAIAAVRAHGGVLAATGRLSQRSGHLVYAPGWSPAPAEHRSCRALQKALGDAAKRGRELAAAVGVAPRPGLHAIRMFTPTTAARLAAQWYPQPGGIAEPASPSASTPAQPGLGRTVGRRRTR